MLAYYVNTPIRSTLPTFLRVCVVLHRQMILRGYFEDRYVPTVKCVYSRKKLFREVVAYLKGVYHLTLLTPSDARYKWILKEVEQLPFV